MPKTRAKRTPISDADRAFWSFQPVRAPQVPSLTRPGSSAGVIDQFFRPSLPDRALPPAPEAAGVTLIRRATSALHGLPPTPAEVEAYVSDSSPDAYQK